MCLPPKGYFESIEEMKHSIDAFTHNQCYVICKQCFDKDFIDYKYNREEIYYDQNYHIHKQNSVSRLIGCPFELYVHRLDNNTQWHLIV